MKRIITTLITCLAILLFVSACTKTEYDLFGNISGTVVENDSSEPVSQAIVTINPTAKNTYTGTDGSFEFRGLEAQQYTVTVQKTGYQANRKTITVNAGETTNIQMILYK